MNPKKCKSCGQKFTPQRPMQQACSIPCAVDLANKAKAKAVKVRAQKERKEIKAKKESLKSRADWAREAQTAVNRYVRLRDAKNGCVSCDKPANWQGQWHASHYRSVGAAGNLRFHLWNIHKACSVCNNHLSGNLAEYEPRLRAKIGDEKGDWLRGQNGPVKYSIDYLKRIKAVFTKKARRLEARL